jgi:formylglycine-generating enzyme required for sulfatase activity
MSHGYIEPELVHIPAGDFWMGSDGDDPDAWDWEKPFHQVNLPDYWIGVHPVTNDEYFYFLVANPDHPLPGYWINNSFPVGKEAHPVEMVNWYDAMAFCHWLSEVSGRSYTLPSEAEWEKAARGSDGRIYPWGNEFDRARLNSHESGLADTSPVGKFSPLGDSPYGCFDMAGNVWEWTRNLWGPNLWMPDYNYPYNPQDGRENADILIGISRVLRGGSWIYDHRFARCATRDRYRPGFGYFNIGFRVAVSPAFTASPHG